MNTYIKRLIGSLAVLLTLFGCVAPVGAQTYLTATTLNGAITSTSATTLTLTSASTVTTTTLLFVDRELMRVTAINGTTISVIRGAGGTRADTHATSANVLIVHPEAVVNGFANEEPAGSCTAANYPYLPLVDVGSGFLWSCRSGVWKATSSQPVTYNSFLTGKS